LVELSKRHWRPLPASLVIPGTHDPQSPRSTEGLTSRPNTPAETCRLIEEALHYRGDVTLLLQSGERIEGYLFNRQSEGESPFLQMFIEGQSAPRHILYSEIVAVSFSGEDTASGKDWEAWVRKKESERRVESARVEAAARARGDL
jgi:hypothetical protein